jgi:phosphoribosylformimino-5-aminoimidazole carboxamide ribotide isomerase
VIPSIDVMDGRVVRLERGDTSRVTVYSDDPSAVARRWASAGARMIHLVDIDGAVSGEPRNAEAVARAIDAAGVEAQVAGGIRNMLTARSWLEAGAARVVIGTAAFNDPPFLDACVAELGSRLVVAPDARDGEVRLAGWREGSGLELIDAARDLAARGVARLLVTDIARDGVLTGPNLDQLAEVSRASRLPLIASGGVRSVEDLRALAEVDGVEAAVVGRALYNGDLDLEEALAACSRSA